MSLICIQTISVPERALGWLLYYFFLSLALSTRALGLLGSAMVLIPGNLEKLLRELFLLSRGWIGLFNLSVLIKFCECHLIQYILTSSTIGADKEAMGFDGLSEPMIPLEEFLNLCSPAASWADGDSNSLTAFSVSSPTPSLTAGTTLSTCGDLASGYCSSDESSTYGEHQDGGDFDDCASDESSTYGEIPRDLYFNGAAAARWNSNTSHPPLDVLVDREISCIGSNVESNTSDASSEYELVSRNRCFDWCEAVRGVV